MKRAIALAAAAVLVTAGAALGFDSSTDVKYKRVEGVESFPAVVVIKDCEASLASLNQIEFRRYYFDLDKLVLGC